jgi:exopolysaccharide production protein ExoQ
MTVQTSIGLDAATAGMALRARRRRGLRPTGVWASLISWDALFAFAMTLPLLFVYQLGSLSPALFLLFALTCCGFYYRWFLKLVLNRWVLLITPVLAIASFVWSAYPGETLKYATETAILAAAGLVLSGAKRPIGVLGGVAGAFAIFMLASVALGGSVVMVEASGSVGDAFAGLNTGKNLMGVTAAIAVLLTVAMLTVAYHARSTLLFAAGVLVLAADLYAVTAARSAGALLGLVAALGIYFVALTVARLSGKWRLGAIALLILLLLLVAAFSGFLVKELVEFASTVFHKDPTLTGRTYLWYRGQDLIHERPFLGRGYAAFWVQGNTDAEGLWRYGGMNNRSGFNFHNTVMELVIHLGWIGAALILASFAMAAVLLLRRLATSPSVPTCFYFAFLAYQLSRTPFESLMPSPNDFQTLILFIGLGFGFRSVPVMRPRPAQARPVTVAATAVFEPRLQLPKTGGAALQPPMRRRLIGRR